MVSLFRTAHPVSIFILLGMCVLLHLNLWLQPVDFIVDSNAPVGKWLSDFLHNIHLNNSWLLPALSICWVFLTSLYFNGAMQKHQLVDSNSLVPALFYISIFGLLNQFYFVTPTFIAIPLLILFLDRLFSTIFSDNNLYHSFDLGLVTCALFFLYRPFILLLVVAILCYIFITNFYWRYMLSILCGFVAAALTFFGIWLLADAELVFIGQLFSPIKAVFHPIELVPKHLIALSVVPIGTILLYLLMDRKSFKVTPNMRKLYFLLLGLLALSCLLLLFHSTASYEALMLFVICGLIMMISFAVHCRRDLFVNVVQGLILSLALVVQYGGL